jgi:CelD/BcsL family acetyltransferase involved in cellulose biosynthesis
LRHAGRYLSALNQGRFSGLKAAEQLAMARAHEDLSKKFRYNQRRELRLLEEAGGWCARSVTSPRPDRRDVLRPVPAPLGLPATGAERMAEVVERLRELLIGSVLLLNDAPIAIQLVYRVEAPQWISVEYVNGGVDPETKAFSPGSVLSFLNTQAAWEMREPWQAAALLLRPCRP